MNIITALNNQHVQDLLKGKCPDMVFPLQDISYQEALLDTLKAHNPDTLLINMTIEGELSPQDFITKVRKYNNTAKIVLILKEENQDFKNWLASKAVYDTFTDGQCTFEDIIVALKKEREVIVKTEVVVEEKILEREKIVTREKVVRIGFKKLILPVIASTELACEMAYCAAKLTGLKVAIVNLDTVKGFTDIYLGQKRPDKGEAFLFTAESKGGMIPGIPVFDSSFTWVLDNLLILDLAATPQKLFHLKPEEIVDTLLACYSLFDLTIVSANWDSPYIRHAVSMADYSVIVTGAYLDELAASSALAENIISKDIPFGKLLYVFHEYKPHISLSETNLKATLGERYIGKILYDDARYRSRNRDGPEGFYCSLCYPLLRPQYIPILAHFNLYPTSSSINSIRGLLVRLFNKKDIDYSENDNLYTSHDLSFAVREAAGILAYAAFIVSRYAAKLIKSLLSSLKIFFNPFLIILLLALLVILQLLGVNLLGLFQDLFHKLY